MKNNVFACVILFLASCSLSPGMHLEPKGTWLDEKEYVFIESINRKIYIEDINDSNLLLSNKKDFINYRLGKGDQVSIIVWGLPEIFPISGVNPDVNVRRIDSNGNIFFPYIGSIKAEGRTENELRIDITKKLSEFFNMPQLDISITEFNSQKIYILGEVTRPLKMNITDVPTSLAQAIGDSYGLNTTTSNGSDVYIIRQQKDSSTLPKIYRADLASPSGFIAAGEFYLSNNDIVYVNANGTARWNRVVSQFFPFSTFLNSVDNLVDNNN